MRGGGGGAASAPCGPRPHNLELDHFAIELDSADFLWWRARAGPAREQGRANGGLAASGAGWGAQAGQAAAPLTKSTPMVLM
jgi:hypothetical protein